MASLISCPHCGSRSKEEFSIRGDASLTRPAPDAGSETWYDYVYLRNNPKGRHSEYWHHSSGCRRWLVVERDTVTHAVYSVCDAALAKREANPA
jgi:sarcosine oxidase subunit delta